MSRGLPVRKIPVFVGGGVDTKVDPKLMPSGELVEVENMYYLRTGELRLRNGFAKQTGTLTSGDNLFPNSLGGLMTTSPVASAQASPSVYDPTLQVWDSAFVQATPAVYPQFTAKLTSLSQSIAGNLDSVDPTIATAGNYEIDGSVQGVPSTYIRNWATGAMVTTTNGVGSRPPVMAAVGVFLVGGTIGTAAPATLSLFIFNTTTGVVTGFSPVVAGILGAGPWFDIIPVPGSTTNVAIAWRANAGGVSCAIVNVSTLAVVTGPVNTAGADASMCLGWMDDTLSTGNLYLATAGAGPGVVVRTMSIGALAVTATNVIDAGAVANVRNITGHIVASATDYAVLWDISNATTQYDKVRFGRWTGAATLSTLAQSFSLYSRTFKATDGRYYFVGAYDSTLQGAYVVVAAYLVANVRAPSVVCVIAAGEGGGRRVNVSSLTNIYATGSDFICAISRRTKLTTASGVGANQLRTIQRCALKWQVRNFMRPRELGGTVFIPAGSLMKYDGVYASMATFPFYIENVALASAATGGMTPSGTYSYRMVIRRTDSGGRVSRSAASVPVSITLGAGDAQVTVTFQTPRVCLDMVGIESLACEVYRAGPAASGDTNYNKVGEAAPDQVSGGDTTNFLDTMSDANSELGELLYSTGNVLENFTAPSCNLLEVCNRRVWVVNAENPTELWPSGEYKTRLGVKFNQGLAFSITGDGYGDITALAQMDGRLIVFKAGAIYVVTGDGPNDLGQGSFNNPQLVSNSIGTVEPGSVVATPDGIMFHAAARRGIYLLDRGLGLQPIGQPVRFYTSSLPIVDASLVESYPQVRFVQANGRCVVWDFHVKKWTTFLLRVDTNGVASTIVACATIPGDAWYYLLADGSLMKETVSVFSDVNVTTLAIVPRVGLPALDLAGINGFQRIKGIEILGTYIGDHTLAADFEYDYSGSVTETRTIPVTSGNFQFEVKVAQQKCTAIKVTLRTSVLAAGSGAFALTGVMVLAAMKQGTNIPYTKRLT
jgi:hypothetical protein